MPRNLLNGKKGVEKKSSFILNGWVLNGCSGDTIDHWKKMSSVFF